jgi:radical SAM superfamily enzyme YgiQ (UPF0313 family)
MSGNGLDVVFVNPGGRRIAYQRLGDDLAAVEPPVWAGLMASYARRAGLEVAVVDANAEGLTAEECAARVAAMAPRLVALVVYGHNPSASTQVMPAARHQAEHLRASAPGAPLLIVGGHVAALPERTLREEPVDFVCTGEGPVTVVALARALRESGRPRLDRVPGLGYRDGDGDVAFTPAAVNVTALDDEMPGMAWDLLPVHRYRAHNWHCFESIEDRTPYAALYTTLGCPYKCSFCCIQAPFKPGEQALGLPAKANSYRRWSPARVVDELELLHRRYGVRHVKLADELFVLHRSHVEGICRGIIERSLDLNIWAYARVDSVRDDLLELLRRAGVRWLALGIEAGNERVRSDVSKGFAPERLAAVMESIRRAGIYVIGNYIFGLPEDDRESMQQTLDLALELECEMANFYCAMAYPGSRLYDQALAQDWELPASWSGYSQLSRDTLPLPTRHLDGRDVLAFRDAAFQRYFTEPRILARIEQTFGPEARRHVEQMTRQEIVRDHVPALQPAR